MQLEVNLAELSLVANPQGQRRSHQITQKYHDGQIYLLYLGNLYLLSPKGLLVYESMMIQSHFYKEHTKVIQLTLISMAIVLKEIKNKITPGIMNPSKVMKNQGAGVIWAEVAHGQTAGRSILSY